ncbi:MAG: hypothetical protein HC866_15775 [Leptolyngbyaceae cyanobacterium RU_5_1]|nr:hypothetical protein [Leptolyngbyaceae cyanobacterium RU_5_1]
MAIKSATTDLKTGADPTKEHPGLPQNNEVLIMKQHFDLNQQAQKVMTYLLTLVNGQQHILVPCDAHGSVMEETEEDSEILRGQLWAGGTVEVPISQVFMVEQRYRVTIFTGQTSRTEKVSEAKLEQILEKNTNKETGEVQHIREIKDTQNSENRVNRYAKEF